MSELADLLARLKAAGIELRVEDGNLRYSAKKGALSTELREAIASRKEEILEQLGAGRQDGSSIPRVPRDGPLPLSFSQERILFLAGMDPTGRAWSVPVGIRIRGPFDPAAMARSLTELVRRHEILRTVAQRSGEAAVQMVREPGPFELPVIEAADVDGEERRRDVIDRAARELLDEPFDLEQGPLLRARIIRFDAADHAFVITTHLFICDGWSLEIVFDEIGVLYEAFAAGRRPALHEPGLHYADFSVWQRRGGGIADEKASLAFWRDRLANMPEPLDLPADRGREGRRFGRVAEHRIEVGRERSMALRELSRACSATPFAVFLSVWQVLLSAWSRRDRLLVGTVVSNRGRAELERMPGTFANTVALLASFEGDPSFRDYVLRTRDEALGCFAHQDLPFERLVEELGATPEIRALFVYHQRPMLGGLTWKDLEVSRHPIPGLYTNLDLDLVISDHGDRFAALIEYDADSFDASRIDTLAAHWIEMLDRVQTNPETRISVLKAGLTVPPGRQPARSVERVRASSDETTSDLERAIARIFAELTRYSDPSPHDYFFEIGGHSLSALQAIARLEKLTGVPVDPGDLMMQTIGQLAATIESRRPRFAEKPRSGGLFSRLAGAFRGRGAK